jgi:hypothetical protein
MEQFENFLLIPQMVAARDDIHAGGKYFFGRPGGYARTAGGILPVRDDKIQGEPFPQPGQEHFDGAPSRFSDDITNKKQIHAGDFSANPGKNTQEKIPGSLRMSFQVHGKLARWTLWAPLAQKVARPHPGLLKV